MNEQIYIIGDVHGCYKTLLELIEKLPKDARICFVGDLCDRGNNSKEVIEFVKSNNYDCVLGNHEEYFIEYSQYLERKLSYFDIKSYFSANGGKETVNSYRKDGILDRKTLLEHAAWLQKLPLYREYKDIKTEDNRYLVVSHSHFWNKWEYRYYPKNTNEHNSFKKASLHSRFKNFDNKEIFNVFGHTPTQEAIVENHKASIDLGCVFGNDAALKGRLCALEFPSMKVITQDNTE